MLLEMGHQFCKTLLEFSERDKIKYNATLKELEAIYNVPKQINQVDNPVEILAKDPPLVSALIKAESYQSGSRTGNSTDSKAFKSSYIRQKFGGIKRGRKNDENQEDAKILMNAGSSTANGRSRSTNQTSMAQ
jgi:hypothetical protein